MEENFINWVSGENVYYIHLGIFILLMLGAIGFPMPEDIPIILAGVAASKQLVRTEAIFLTCYVSLILGDMLVYTIGYFFGEKIVAAGTNSKFLPSVTEDKVARVREGLRKRRLLYIFLARHLFAIRSLTFLISGAVRVPFLEFVVADAIAALFSASIIMGLGYFLGEQLSPEALGTVINQAGYILIICCVLIVLFWFYKKRNNTKKVD